jgi:hypothetical protein
VRRWIERDHIGGVSMSLGTPVEIAAKINNMQRLSRVPLLASADLEPGLGRLEGGTFTHYLLDAGSATVFPSAMAIAATGRDQDAYDVAKIIAQEARAVGIQINFSPVVDVNNNPSNPVIYTRSFGENAARVARLSALFVRGAQDGGRYRRRSISGTWRHGCRFARRPADRRRNWRRLDTLELVPFRAAINAGVGMVMTAHIALPAVEGDSTTPATLAPKIITGVLRDSPVRWSGDHRRDDDGRRGQGLQRGGELGARRESGCRHHSEAERPNEGDRRRGGGGGARTDLARTHRLAARRVLELKRARALRSTRSWTSMPYARSSVRRTIVLLPPTSRAAP